MRLARTPDAFVPVSLALTAVAWLSLWAWSVSPYARYLGHDGWTSAMLLEVCRAFPAVEWVAPALLYVAGWVLMITAMMLPTTVPLLDIVRGLVRDRDDRRRLVALVAAGYLAVWLPFGVAAHLLDHVLHLAAERAAWVALNGWLIGTAILALAGVFQWSALKERCLDECRTPLGFAMRHWRGGNYAINAFRLGASHGLFCLGCCWALMLVMFAVGTASVGWMIVLGAAMAAEKNLTWGRRLTTPIGAALLAGAASLAITNLT